MSSEDQLRPYHAKDKTSGQEAADAVAAVLHHAAIHDEAAAARPAPKKQAKWMLPLGINLGVFAVYLLLAPPAWVVMNPIASQPIEERVDDLRLAMYMQAMRVDSYMQTHGELPATLEDAGSAIPGVDYIRQGVDRYRLVAAVGEETLLYDSTESAAEWVGEAADALRGG
jgi:hypothetical protein